MKLLPHRSFVQASKHPVAQRLMTEQDLVDKDYVRRTTHNPIWLQRLVAFVTVAVVTGILLWIYNLIADAMHKRSW